MGVDTQRSFDVDARANSSITVRLYRRVLHVVLVNHPLSLVEPNRLNGGSRGSSRDCTKATWGAILWATHSNNWD